MRIAVGAPLVCAWLLIGGAAFGASSVESNFEFRQDEKSLYEGLKSSTTNTRVRSAIYLWTNFPSGRSAAEQIMEHDPDANVRRRIAQVLAAKQKAPKAIEILRQSLEAIDIETQAGAMGYLISAQSLRAATGEVVGVDRALQILSAPATWFADVNGSTWSYSQRDAPRVMAASYLLEVADDKAKPRLQAGLRAYIAGVADNLSAADPGQRKYWEARLPTALDLGIRGGLASFVATFEGREHLFKDTYELERFKRVLKRAKAK